MDGVKVTYIETRFVTSDTAGFKDLVQRLTGRSAAAAPAPAAPLGHRPRAAPQGCYHHASASSSTPAAHEPRVGYGGRAPPCQDETYGAAGLLYYGGSASQKRTWAWSMS
jgi:hypothetical protein